MNRTILRFPGNHLSTFHRAPARSHSHHRPCSDELIYSSLDLSFQSAVTVSRTDREIIDSIPCGHLRGIYA